MIPKIRVYIKKENRIANVEYVDYVGQLLGAENCENDLDFDEVEIMQSTGLKDKNGIEIFEGDILEHCDRLYTIRYNPNFGLYSFKGLTEFPSYDSAKHSNYYEIIGNIYENKELLD